MILRKPFRGGSVLSCPFSYVVVFCWLRFGDVREGSDEEHSTWSGGMGGVLAASKKTEKVIKWEKAIKWENEKNDKMRKYKISYF